MTSGTQTPADLLVKVDNFVEWRKRTRSGIRLRNMPLHLATDARIWLTWGNCRRTFGYFELTSAPIRRRGVLTFARDAALIRNDAVWLRVGKWDYRECDVHAPPESQGRGPLISRPGEFRYVRRPKGRNLYIVRFSAGSKPRGWRPYCEGDTRLDDLRELVLSGDRSAIVAWFRRSQNRPAPTYSTEAALIPDTETELDHLVPVRALVDRLQAGTLSIGDIPVVLVTVTASKDEHRWITEDENPKRDDRLKLYTALMQCPTADLIRVAAYRYAGYNRHLLPVDDSRSLAVIDIGRSGQLVDRYGRTPTRPRIR